MSETRPQLSHLTESAFAAVVEPHRRELHVHCYRMLGSFEDAEDQVQETLLRAWRGRDGFEGRSSLRTWLYRIATNACLDALDRRPRPPLGPDGEVLWLQPYPEALLDEVPDSSQEPHAAAVERETIELAFLIGLQHLPPRTRAVLLARDVLGWSAKETADMAGITVAAVNSALQRARAALREQLPAQRSEWAAGAEPAAAERELLRRYIEASEQGDADGLAAVLHEDLVFSMPPEPGRIAGRDAVVGLWIDGGLTEMDMRCLPTRVNRQLAVAVYLRRDEERAYRPFALDVLRLADGQVAEIITFAATTFAEHGLPEELPARDATAHAR
jgi:RNA polymerase sigma-70 factor (ECF subfamily)